MKFGQAEERAPEVLLKDLIENGAYLEDVVQCLEKVSCKQAVNLLCELCSICVSFTINC